MSSDAASGDDAQAGGIIDVESTESFDEAIAENDQVVVDYFADWCGPCKQQTPILEELSGTIDAPVLGVDTDEYNGLAAEAGVRSIPTVAVYRGGEEVERFVGVTGADEIRAALE
ncbi:co-chaperone YbbN [Halorubrum sp. SP9]|uniref:thioredoxin family protein n=1 Tax=Halorubrum sp. SP9 TaxID=1537267 RepID=UPI0010F7E675|nr:thioredoxin family protein [Halorubrum sp. SP9]TKX66971.1 thioredoxin [Halorubrum sp. SP9]